MKKHIIFAITFVFFGVTCTNAQYVLKDQDDVKWYQNLPQETIFIANNASLLFAGETLYYKVFCKNAKTKLLSKNSKIAYLELIGENGLVFKHKIRLDTGLGQGDFFIPVSVKTGNYKLIGYTRWMQNREEDNFYETDIAIINPYASINFTEDADVVHSKNTSDTGSNNLLTINTNANSYNTRSIVNLTVEGLDVGALGNYIISARKLENMTNEVSNELFKDNFDKVVSNKPKSVGETIFLPEFKGEMLTGVVTDKATGKPSEGLEIALSVLSEEAIQDITKTNSKGIFYFQIKDNYKTPRCLIQVIGENRMNHILKMDDDSVIDYSKFQFKELKLEAELKKAIIEHSINNQIQNAYISVTKDEVVAPDYPESFYGNPRTTYRLDDYKRFKDIAITLDEVIDHAYHERKRGKTRYINVRERETDPYYDVDILPLVLVDGASVQDHQGLLSFETKNVESISVLRQEYYYGDKVYQGVLMINTFNKDYHKSLSGDHLEVVDLTSPQLNTKYFKHDYSNNTNFDRIPDQRTQLLWLPNLNLREKTKQIEFYTSDNTGAYRISLKGYTNSGEPVSINKTITVN